VPELRDAVKQCVERLERFQRHTQKLGEQNTKANLVEPIIDALGWDTYDPDEVHREYRRRGSDNPVDYALLLLRTPRLFIEAKGLGENLDDPRWANQTISYAAVAGVEWVALTDGAEWRIYNAHAPVPIEQKLFRAVRVDADLDTAVELLCLLSKENMRENRIEEMWKGFFIDRQVHAELVEMFGSAEPPAELVTLLGRRLSKLTRDDIRSSLVRARATFDFPIAVTPPTVAAVPIVSAGTEPAVPELRSTGTGRRSAPVRVHPPRRITARERQIKVRDMIAAGRLRAGATLHADYLGTAHRAELLADGRVRYGGQDDLSLSAAGRAAKISVRGPDAPESVTATDGLEFWRTKDERAGDVVSIKEIRRRVAEDS
jgi:Restriction Enzyme Adenine Methylase Associated